MVCLLELFFMESKRRLHRFALMLADGAPEFPDLGHFKGDFKGATASFGAKMATNL